MTEPVDPWSDFPPSEIVPASRYQMPVSRSIAVVTPSRNAVETRTALEWVTKTTAVMIWGPAIIVMASGRIDVSTVARGNLKIVDVGAVNRKACGHFYQRPHQFRQHIGIQQDA